MSEPQQKKNKSDQMESTNMEMNEDDLYEFIEQFVAEGNPSTSSGAVPTPVEQNASVIVLIGDLLPVEFKTFKKQFETLCHDKIRLSPLKSSIISDIRIRANGEQKDMKANGLIINMPQAATCFCTHCLGTISPIQEEIDQHVKNCYAKIFNAEYCHICNAKNTTETAAVHYASKGHEKKTALHTVLSKNRQQYYVSTSGVTTDVNSSVLKKNVVFCIDPKSTDKLAAIKTNESIYQKTDEEKLHDLIEQMAMNKTKTTDLVGKELTQRNECIKMFHSLLASINIGYVPCYYPRVNGDFLHPAVLLEAVKKSAIKKIAKSEVGKNNPAKVTAMENIFTPQTGDSMEKCRICKNNHETKYYDDRQADIIFKMIEGVMNSI